MEQARMAEYCRVTFEFQLRKALKTVSHRVIAATPPPSPTIPFDIPGWRIVSTASSSSLTTLDTPPLPSLLRKGRSPPPFRNGATNENCFDLNDFRASYPAPRDFFSYTASWTGTFERRQAQMRDVHIYIWRERERKRTRTLEHSTLLSLIFFDL